MQVHKALSRENLSSGSATRKDSNRAAQKPNLAKLSHLNVHMVNRLLRENRKSIPNFLMVKNFLKM